MGLSGADEAHVPRPLGSGSTAAREEASMAGQDGQEEVRPRDPGPSEVRTGDKQGSGPAKKPVLR